MKQETPLCMHGCWGKKGVTVLCECVCVYCIFSVFISFDEVISFVIEGLLIQSLLSGSLFLSV